MKRKLTSIFYADVAGDCRLTGADEEGTHFALTAHLATLAAAIDAHGGRICHFAGDAVLAEFSSVIDALECAVAAQRDLAERDKDVPENHRLRFRIGVNLGDVMVDGAEIYGNGVNVAARLEALADPGGICVSERVFEQVEKNVDVGFAFLSTHKVKNIEKPVRAYKVLLDPKFAGKTIDATRERAWQWSAAAAVLILIAALGGMAIWLRPSAPEVKSTIVEHITFPLPDKPSIAVLPFDTLSGDPEVQFLADGITEDIITTLSRVPDLLVIARNSTFTYKNKPVKVDQVATELGVRYVIEGSLQRSGDWLRVTAQLIDATTGHHLWADRFDRKVDDIFAVQDEIAQKILIELRVKLTTGEHARVASRGTTNLEAWLLSLQAFNELDKLNKDGNLKARDLSLTVVEVDPEYARGWIGLAYSLWFEARMGGWTLPPEEALQKSMEFAERAIELDPQDPAGYQVLAKVMSLKGDYDQAVALVEKAFSIAPGDFLAAGELAFQLVWAGEFERAMVFFARAKRLSPKYPAWIDWMLGLAQLMAGRPEDAIVSLQRGVDRAPHSFLARGRLVAGYAALNRLDEARAEAAGLLQINPDMTASKFVDIHPFKDPVHRELLRELLLKAGLPEGRSS